ncbi:hypothetical protein HBI23_245970 [Parastagonospora nodorum]|nr:hypothetical protein HBI23_245970 [Parastagonospora nodorum]KAH5622339.1 hypothetical protein HBI51_246180 [Parastagonospora nodorum]KAH6380594.1 hypothetical protein HBI08_234750 [Parastagonospora nodorum]
MSNSSPSASKGTISHWLGRNLSQLQSAVKGPQQLAGIPVVPSSKLAPSHQQALWSVYKVAESVENGTTTAPPPIEDAQDDAPPAYAQVSSKRLRHTRTSLTPDSPLPKRIFLEDLTRSVSPTKCATPSSQGHRSTSSNATVVVDLWQEAINKGLDIILPKPLPKLLPTILKHTRSQPEFEKSGRQKFKRLFFRLPRLARFDKLSTS